MFENAAVNNSLPYWSGSFRLAVSRLSASLTSSSAQPKSCPWFGQTCQTPPLPLSSTVSDFSKQPAAVVLKAAHSEFLRSPRGSGVRKRRTHGDRPPAGGRSGSRLLVGCLSGWQPAVCRLKARLWGDSDSQRSSANRGERQPAH